MSIIKYNKLNTEFDNVINEVANMFWRSPMFQLERNWRPEDITQTDKDYTIEVELPRVKREEVRAEVIDNKLVITAKTEKLHYERSFALNDANFNDCVLKLENGVLSVKVPKMESSRKALTIG